MRRCKLEFLIFFNLAILEQQQKKKSWSGQDGKSTEQLLINGGDSQLFMGVIPNISHWQGQVFPLPSLYFFPAPPFPTALSITSRSQISHIRCHTDIYRNPRGLKQLWGSRLSALSIRSTETRMAEQ